jgi:HK97 family phage portal protein
MHQLSRELAKALQGALGTNLVNRSIYLTAGADQPIVTPDTPQAYIHDAYQFNPDVFSVITLRARSAAQVPWVVYRVTNKKALKQYKRLPSEAKRHNLTRVVALKERAMEEAEGSDLENLLNRPNPYQGRNEFFEGLFGFKLITGNAYIHGVKIDTGRNAGKIAEMWHMPPQLTEIIASGDPEHIIKGYRINWYGGRNFTIPAEDVLHLKYFNPDYTIPGSNLYGMSPLQAARRVVVRSNEAYAANAKMLRNMAPPGILMFDDPNVNFTPESASELERKYDQKTGSKNAGKLLVTAAKFNYQQIGLNAVDMNIIESQKMDLRDICNVYQVSSELLNDPDNKTNSNKKESRQALYYEAVIPDLDSLRDDLNRWLTPTYNKSDGVEYYIDYDISAIPALQEDMKKVVEQMGAAWWTTGNEKRRVMGYDDETAMAGFFVPSNMVPFDGNPVSFDPADGL